METSVSTTEEAGGRETWRSSEDALFESLLQEVVDSPAAGETPPANKWSSEELLASCQALLQEARGAVTTLEVPHAPVGDQCTPRGLVHHSPGQRQLSPASQPPPPDSHVSSATPSPVLPSSSETISWASPAVEHTDTSPVGSQLPTGMSPVPGTPSLAPVARSSSPNVSWASRPLNYRDLILPVLCSGSQHSQHPTTSATHPSTTKHLFPDVPEPMSASLEIPSYLSQVRPSPERLQLLQETPSHQQLFSQRVSPTQQVPLVERPPQEPSFSLPRTLVKLSLSREEEPLENLSIERLVLHNLASPEKLQLERVSSPVRSPPEQLSFPGNSSPEQLTFAGKSSLGQISSVKSPTLSSEKSSSVKSSPERLSSPGKSPPGQPSSQPLVPSPLHQFSSLASSPELSTTQVEPSEQLSPPAQSPLGQSSPLSESPPGLSSVLQPPLEKWAPMDPSPSDGSASLRTSAVDQPQAGEQSDWVDGDAGVNSAYVTCQSAAGTRQAVRLPLPLSVPPQPQQLLTQDCQGCHSHATSSAHTARGCVNPHHVHRQPQTTSCLASHRASQAVITSDTREAHSASRPSSHSFPGFVPSAPAAASWLPSASHTCGLAVTTVTAEVTSAANDLMQTCLVDSVCHTTVPAAPYGCKAAQDDLQDQGTSLNHVTERLLGLADGVCVSGSGVQLVSRAWHLDGSPSSVSSSCASPDKVLIGETLISDSEDDESLLTFKTCSSSDNESGSVDVGGAWCSCGEVFSIDGEAATDADSEYSLDRFAPSSEDLWQWNPSYKDDDQEASHVFPSGDSAGDVRAVASQVLLGHGAAHCQELLLRSVSGHSLDVDVRRQVLSTLPEGDRLTDGRPDGLPRVETKDNLPEGVPSHHTVYPPHTVRCESSGGAGGAQCLWRASRGASDILTPALVGHCVDRVSLDDSGSSEYVHPLPRSPASGQELVDVVLRRGGCAMLGERRSWAAGVRKDGSAPPHTLLPVPHELCRHHQAPRRPLEPRPTESHHLTAPRACTNSCVPRRRNTEEQDMMAAIFSDGNCALRKSGLKRMNFTCVDDSDPGDGGYNSGGLIPPVAVPKVPEPEPEPTLQEHTVQSINSVTSHDEGGSVRDVSACVVEGKAIGETVNCGADDYMEVCGAHYGVGSESDVKCVVRGKAGPPLAEAPVVDGSASPADQTVPDAALPLACWCRSCAVSVPPPPAAHAPPADPFPQFLTAAPPRPLQLPSRPQQLPQLSSPLQTTKADPTCIVLPKSGSVARQSSPDNSGAPADDPSTHHSLFSSQDSCGKSTVILSEGSGHRYSSAGMKTDEAEIIMKRNVGREELCEAGGGAEGVLVEREAGSAVLTPILPGVDDCGATLPTPVPGPPHSPNGPPFSTAPRNSYDDRTGRICERGQRRGECGVKSEQDRRDSWQQRGDGGQEQRDRRLRGARRDWRLVHALPQDNPHHHHHLIPTRLACSPPPHVDGSLSSSHSASRGHERSRGTAVSLDRCDLAWWLQGSECQVPRRAGTGGPGWTGSCGHGTVGEAHVARCPGEVIGSLQVLVGDVLWRYPLYGTVHQCRHDADDVWELVQAGQGWHTAIDSGGELVTMSSDSNSMAGPAAPSTALQPEPPTGAKTHPIYGYKVVNKEQGKVKSLLPVYGDGKSSSARDINSVTFRVKGDSTWQTQRPNRNSDVCDVHMYRVPESRGGTPALSDDGDGSAAVIKLCGVSLGSRPDSPDPYPLFRCHTLPRKAPTNLRLSSLPPWPQAPLESPVTSPESEVAMSAPTSPRFSQAPCVALQGEPDSAPGSNVAPGTPVDTTSRDSMSMSAGDKCSAGSLGAGDDGGEPPEPPALGTAPPRPPAPSFYQWCHIFTRSREANKGANHSPEHTTSTAPTPWGIPGPPLRTTSRCGRDAVTPRPYTGGRSNQTFQQVMPNAREEEGVASVRVGSDAVAPSSPRGVGRTLPFVLANTQPPLAGVSYATTCKAKFQPPLPGAGGQNPPLGSSSEAPGSWCESPGEVFTAGEAGRPAAPAVADRLTTRRSRQATSQMTSADTSLTVQHPPPPPPDDSLSAAPILPPDVSPSVSSLMGSADTPPDLHRQPVERGPREGAPTATTPEDRRATATEAGTKADLPVWLRIMKSSPAQCSAPAQAALPQPPIRSSSKLEPCTPGIRNSGSVHNGANMPKKYSLPAGLTQAGNTQLYPTPKWLVADKTEFCHDKHGASQEAPAVTEPCYGQKGPSQPVTATAEPSPSQREATQEVAACTELNHKEKGFAQTVSATDNPSHSERESSRTLITTAEPCFGLKESSQTVSATADPCCQKGPSQTVTSIPKPCNTLKEPTQADAVKADPCHNQKDPSQVVTATAEPYSQKEPTQIINVTAKPFYKEQRSIQPVAATREPCHSQKLPSQTVTARNEPFHNRQMPSQTLTVTTEPFLEREVPSLELAAVPLQKETSQLVVGSVESCQSQKAHPQAVIASAQPFCSQRGPPKALTTTVEPCSQRGPSQAMTTMVEPCRSQKVSSQAVTTTVEPSSSQRGSSQAVTTSAEFSPSREGSSQAVAARLERSAGKRGPSQAETGTGLCYRQRGPPQAVTATTEPTTGPSQAVTSTVECLSQRGPSQAVTSTLESLSQRVPSQAVTNTVEPLSQRVPSQAVTSSAESSHSKEGSSHVVAAKLEPSSGKRGPSQAVTGIVELCYSQRGRPSPTVTATNEECLGGPSLAGTAINEDHHNHIGPAQGVTTTDEDFHNQIQPFQTVASTDDVCLSQGGSSEAKTTTNEARHSQKDSTQAVNVTTVIRGHCPPKCSTNDTQPSFAVSASEMPPVRDLDTTYPHTSPSSVPSHHQKNTADTDDFPSPEMFQSASSLCTPGFDKREVLHIQQENIPVCDEQWVSPDDERCGEGNNQRDSSSTCGNTERAEEPDVVGKSSSCLSGTIVEEQNGGLSEDNVTLRDIAVGGVVGDSEPGEMPTGALLGNAGGREDGVGVGQGSGGAPRGTGTSERAAFIISQQQDGGQTQQRPRSTRFPLDIICGTRLHHQRESEHSPSRFPRQRISSVDQVQFLTPGPTHGNGSTRSKSASRIGYMTTDAAIQSVSQTQEFGTCGKGTGGASDTSSREDRTTSPLLVPRSPILPLDTVLENKIKQTIDSFTGSRVDGDTATPAPALLPEFGAPGSSEDTGASQSDDATSQVTGVGRSTSDVTTHDKVTNETSSEHLKDAPEKEFTAITQNTVASRDAVDNVAIPGNDKSKEAEEIHVKCAISVEGVCPGVIKDFGEDIGGETLRGSCQRTSHPSVRSQDSTRREALPATVNDSVAQDMAGLTDVTVQPDGGGTGVKELLTSVLQDEESAAFREGFSKRARQDVQQPEYNQGLLSCFQQRELQLGRREQQQQQEECKVSEEGEAGGSTVPPAQCPSLAPTTGLSRKTSPHQLDQTAPRQPSHGTDSSRTTSLLPNYKPGLLYIDECEPGSDKSTPAHREVPGDIPADGQQEFAGVGESSCGQTGEVECDLRDQQVEEARRPPLELFSFPLWTQDLDEKCTANTGESAPEGPGATREESDHELGRVDCNSSDVIRQPMCVVVVDTVASPPGESGAHGTALVRVESVEEYEQAQEVVTPEPSHGFSQSSASVATVVRVDTPCDAYTHLPPEDEEAEDEFVDASDSMDLSKGDAELVEEMPEGEHHLQTHRSSPRLAQSIAVAGVTPQEEVISRTLSVTTSDTQSSGTSHTSSVDMCGTQFAGIVGDPSVSTSGSVSEPVGQDSVQQPVMAGRRGSNMPEDGSTSSGGHITDPDMLASASASSTGSETWWTSGGGPAGQRDLLPLDKDEEEAQWRALLAINLPDTEEEPTGYESDEDFDAVDADMRRLEEKLRKFERELGENSEEDSVPKNGEGTSPPALQSEDLESLQISSLPQVFPAVSSAKTKHLSLMTRLEVQEYEDSTSESDSESDAASSSDSADFLFVKTKIKLKPGDRKCRSLDEKRSKNYILNKSREDRRRASRVKENSCVCEEQLDLSNLNVHLGTLDEEVVPDGREETEQPSVTAQEAGSTTPPGRDDPGEECLAPGQPGDPQPTDERELVADGEDAGGAMLCSGEDHLLLGYIWHEEDGMAAVDFEGFEDFKSFEGQGALMIMYEDDHDDKLHDEDEMFERPVVLPGQTPGEYLVEESECESSWSRGSSCGASVSSPHQSSRGLEKNFLTAFKNSLRKASRYLGPKMESRSRKRDQSPDEASSRHQHNDKLVDSPQLPPDLPYRGRRCSAGLDDDNSAGVYNVQSGRVAPVSTFIPTSDSEGPDAFSCSSGEYYAAPALCVNTSDEDPVAAPAHAWGFHPQQPPDLTHDTHRPAHNHASDPSGPPPMPPPRWVQRRSYVPQNSGTAFLNQRLSTSSEGHDRRATSAVMHPHLTPHPNLPTTSQTVTHSPPTSATHVHAPVERFTNGKDMQLYLMGVASAAPAEGETCQPVVAPGLSGRLAGDGEPLPPLPAPPQFTDDAPPPGGGGWLPHCYPHFTVPNHGNYSCVVPSHRLLRGEADLPVSSPLHIRDASPTIPSHKPVSVKQLKRKQQDKILLQETEEGLEALGCTRCMGVPLMRGRPPEDATHWRQPSPHPRVISDRRSWPPRK